MIMMRRVCCCLLLGFQWSLGAHLRATEKRKHDSVSVLTDIVNEEAPMQHRHLAAGSFVDDSINARQNYWSTVKQLSSFQSAPVWQHDNGQGTLTRLPLLVLPIWFSDETQSAASEIKLKSGYYQSIVEEYRAISFGACELEFKFLEQTKIDVSRQKPTLGQVSAAAGAHIRDTLGLVEDVDYHAVIAVFNNAAGGDLNGKSAWGLVNGRFMWVSSTAPRQFLRHEIGHVLGHYHHSAYQYNWRLARKPTTEDGYDFMSGNVFGAVADFSASSKWWYGWIPDEAVVRLQPEGTTDECPQCLARVTDLVLYPFDSRSVTPSAARPMAVQIPITSRLNRGRPELMAYWLSYRSGIEASARGVSVHLAWSTHYGPLGASLDSLSLDVGGDTSTLTDSFIAEDTCYVIEPPGYLLDLDPVAAKEVRPVVCVDQVVEGKKVQLSVSFLDPTTQPSPKVDLGSLSELGCSRNDDVMKRLALKRLTGTRHLLHYSGTGQRGSIALQLESQHAAVTAYFYDSYPYAPLVLGAPPGHGAFKVLTHKSPSDPAVSLSYLTENNEAYVLLVFDETAPDKAKAWVSSTCTVGQCLANEYLDETGICLSCPSGRVAPMGSLSIEACVPCGDGLAPRGMGTDECVLLPSTTFVEASTEWRIFAPASFTAGGSAWDVDNLSFFAKADCSGEPIDATPLMLTSSGDADTRHASSMVLPGVTSYWGGRTDANGLLYIGFNFDKAELVGCVRFDQTSANYAHKVVMQARQGDVWVNVAIVENQGQGTVTLLNEAPLLVPSAAPSLSPSPSSSLAPTKSSSPTNYKLEATNCLKKVRSECRCSDLILKKDKKCFSSAIRDLCKPKKRSGTDYNVVKRKTIQILKLGCKARLKKQGMLH